MPGERQNCWEFMRCGREAGGLHEGDRGVCPVCTDEEYDGTNGGRSAGRFCWVIAGTFCAGAVQGTFANKFESCLLCPFYREVERAEGRAFKLIPDNLPDRLNKQPSTTPARFKDK